MRVRIKHRRLAQLLARRPLSLNHWAQRIGVGRGHLSQLVNGKRPYPRAETRERLLRALGVEFDELFERVENRPRRPERIERIVYRTPSRRSAILSPRRSIEDLPAGPPPTGDEVMESLFRHLRHATRQLVARPGMSAVAIFILALGLAANTTLFSVAYAMLWEPYPFAEPERIVLVHSVDVERGMTRGTFSYPNFVDVRAQTGTVLTMAAADWEPYGLAGGDEPLRVGGGRVSYNLFEVLGVEPLLGRTFHPEEDRPGGAPVVILSEQLWKSYFAADPKILGREVRINGSPRTVIGVVPAAAEYPSRARLWVPLGRDETVDSRRGNWLSVIARLQDGVSRNEAEAVLRSVAARLEEEYPEANEGRGVRIETFRDANLRDGVGVMMLLQVAVAAFLLLIVCANVAQLLLARGAVRGREMAVRTALGASRPQLAGQLLAESLVLAAIGCGLGVFLGHWGLQGLRALIPVELPAWFNPEINGPVVSYSVGLALAAAVLCGLAPAFQTLRTDLRRALHDGLGATSAHVARLRGALLVGEVALSLVLLVGAGLLVQSVLETSLTDPGFKTEGALTVGIDLLAHIDDETAARQRLVARHLERLAAVPGVTDVGAVDRLPMNHSSNHRSFAIEGQEDVLDRQRSALYEVVSGGYFAAMGIRVEEGTPFGDTPREGAFPLVINRSLADRFFAGEDPIGRRMRFGGEESPWFQVRAVVSDVRHYGIQYDAPASVFVPFWRADPVRMTWVLRTTSDPLALVNPVRAAVAEVDPYQPLHDIRTLGQVVEESYWSWRLFATIFRIVAAVALALSAVGIYGVMSQAAAQRTREVGIRMALGAGYRDVLRLVLWQGSRLVLLGLAVGAPLALFLGKVLSGVLYRVSAFEPLTFGVVLALVVLVGAWATALPAHRAARAHPLEAIRYE